MPADELDPPTESTDPTADIPTEAPAEPTPEPTVEAPTTPVEPAPSATPAEAAAPAARSGILVPKWLAVTVAVLVVFALGLGTGLLIGDDRGGDHDRREGFRSELGDFIDRMGPRQGQGPGANGQSPFGGGERGNANPGPGRQGSAPTPTPTRPQAPNTPSAPNTGSAAFIGIVPEDSTDPAGVAIVRVQASGPAATAGLKSGDVITAVDGAKTDSVATLRSVLADHQPGDVLKVTYSRAGKSATIEVTATGRNTSPPQ